MSRANRVQVRVSRLSLNNANPTDLRVFESTLAMATVWLDEIAERIGSDRQLAWKVLSTVLPKLRCALQPDLAFTLGGHLPRLVRGIYYEPHRAPKQQAGCPESGDFVGEVSRELIDARRLDPRKAISAVFEVIDRHVSAEQVVRIRLGLPRSVRQLWSFPYEARSLPAPEAVPFIAAVRRHADRIPGRADKVLAGRSSPELNELLVP